MPSKKNSQFEKIAAVAPWVALAPGLALLVGSILGFFGLFGAPGPSCLKIASCILGAIVLAAGYHSRGFSREFQLTITVSILLASTTYVLIESSASLYTWRYSPPTNSCLLFETSGKTIHFDAIRGYRLTPIPSRFARISRGKVEFVGHFQGNAQGFQDKHDFTTHRLDGAQRRIAVFGDSFSSSAFLERNWPFQAEHLAMESGARTQYLNFSVDGGGLANWWSILTRFVEPEAYELDAVVFAVFHSDLWRPFAVSEHRGYREHRFGRVTFWDPKRYPKTVDEARPYLTRIRAPIISAAEMDSSLRTKLCPEPRTRPLRPVVVLSVLEGLRLAGHWVLRQLPYGGALSLPPEDSHRLALMDDIARYLRRRGLPAFVVFIPAKETLLDPGASDSSEDAYKADVERFAQRLNARFIDGTKAFEGIAPAEMKSYFFEFDGHWNQRGSDRFAAFLSQHLESDPSLVQRAQHE